MKRFYILAVTLLCILTPSTFAFGDDGINVVPFQFDPFGTHLVAAEWKGGIGCPTFANTAPFLAPAFTTAGTGTYSEPGCPTGDSRDKKIEGLLLAKTGPTNNDASAGATINGVKGMHVTELGYDIRKPDAFGDPRGSHCGAGAPRFNVVTQDNVLHFIGCASPPPVQTTTGFWIRLRWTPDQAFPPIAPTDTIKSLSIVFDEGQDTGPDNFGLAVLDNIDINGTLVGRGPARVEEGDGDEGQGEDGDHGHTQFHDSPSRPETSNVSYENKLEGVKVQSVNGARSVTYTGACVTLVGDALFNDEPGYIVTYAACSVSALGLGVGNISISVAGPAGVVYQKTTPLLSGALNIHAH